MQNYSFWLKVTFEEKCDWFKTIFLRKIIFFAKKWIASLKSIWNIQIVITSHHGSREMIWTGIFFEKSYVNVKRSNLRWLKNIWKSEILNLFWLLFQKNVPGKYFLEKVTTFFQKKDQTSNLSFNFVFPRSYFYQKLL